MGKGTGGEEKENEQDWLTPKEVAKRLNRPAVTIANWRKEGRGPEFFRNGGRVLYKLEEVEKWEKENPQVTKEHEQDWLKTKEVAKRLKRPVGTVRYWREKGKGPEYIRKGCRIFYRLEDVEKWEKEQKVKEKEKRKQDVECLSPAQLSERIGISAATLSNWRIKGLEPPFFRNGYRCLYRIEDVEKWEKKQKVKGIRNC